DRCHLDPRSPTRCPAERTSRRCSGTVRGRPSIRPLPARSHPMSIAPVVDRREPLTNDEIARYSRHLIIPEVALEGQERLKASRVLLVGAGGRGSPLAMYLAAAGVGTIGLVDNDIVDTSNLQRQVIHGTSDLGKSKLVSAEETI